LNADRLLTFIVAGAGYAGIEIGAEANAPSLRIEVLSRHPARGNRLFDHHEH